MSCGCAGRMRKILERAGYELEAGVWVRDGHEIPDDRVEEEHFKVLIETLERRLVADRLNRFFERVGH